MTIRFPFERVGPNTSVSRLRPTVYPRLERNPPRPTDNWLGHSGGPSTPAFEGLAGLGSLVTGEMNPRALGQLYGTGQISTTQFAIWGLISTLGAGMAGYHGWKRTEHYGWTFMWFLMGAWFPVITVPVAFAQGYGKRK